MYVYSPPELYMLPLICAGNGTGIVWDQEGHVSGA